MDKTILKKFAIESRQDLMQKIENKIKFFFVDESFSKEQNGDIYVLSNDKHTLKLSKEEYEKRQLLIERINELGLDRVIEEAAYTWFNRIVAIRYMEIHDYLPLTKENQSLGIRVLSDKDNTLNPEIMKFTNLVNPDLDINFNKEHYIKLEDTNEKFKYIILLVCNKLGKVIPQVFGGVTDYIDILIPDNLLNESGFVNKIVTEVPEENYNQVEIIGWLYQYYNQTEKDRVMSAKNPYTKNEIPYATQIFTPNWIVKYMVENSLGRYWIEHGGDKNIIDNWKYYIETENIEIKEKVDPKLIRCIDPCMGSGHILVYIFEVLYQIYESYGYNKNDICKLILENNLYGIDIDDRAGQLSILSLLLKAREYDKVIFNKKIINFLNIQSIQESNLDKYILNINVTEETKNNIIILNDLFKNAKDIGSLIKMKELNSDLIYKYLENEDDLFNYELKQKIIPLIKQYNILNNNYDIIITNPPYMGHNKMNKILKQYLVDFYKEGKSDLCTAFMQINKVKNEGYYAMINQQAWMSLESFEDLRKYILINYNISSMIHLGFGTFGADFGTTSFVLKKGGENEGIYFSLRETKISEEKEKMYLDKKIANDFYKVNKNVFSNVPGVLISYWLSNNDYQIFKSSKLIGQTIETKKGVLTGNDKKFLRNWYEVAFNKIGFGLCNHKEMVEKNYKWIPVTSGGNYRKWYGNFDSIVNLENDGFEIRNNLNNSSRLREKSYYFKEAITWSEVSMKGFSVRYVPKGILFGNSGPVGFIKNNLLYYLGFLNSNVSSYYLKLLSPTLTFGPEQIKRLPDLPKYNKLVDDLVKENIEISKNDWNSKELSWEFMRNSLIINKFKYIQEAYEFVINEFNYSYNIMKNNEKSLNEYFLKIYNLNNINPEPNNNNIILNKPDKITEIKSLISYAVGCMFGRYSLDEEGLIYAGGTFDENRYKTFKVDKDNIIPITDDAYFADDIVSRFRDFIEVVYGKETLNENLDFIAETLGKKGTETSEDTIRRYFLNDFYKDHVKMYKKKPIYWLFDSGKKNGFKALIYMHRYNENTVPKVRLDYLHRIQNTYDKLLSDVNYRLTTNLTVSDKKIIQNRQADLNAKLQEIKEYDEKIAHIANQRINIDLDDGVTENYAKFGDILAKIK